MTINFKCEHCGRGVEAPDEAGGKRGRCPYCRQSCYIPTPVSEQDVYDLAPEDDDFERRAARERERLRRQELELMSELDGEPSPPVPLEHKEDLKGEDLHHFIVNYCLDLSGSNLERAATHVHQLRKFKPVALQAVDDFISGKAIEPALDAIPSKLLRAFLMQLRDELRKGGG